ncbi:MAG: hypothetical protein ABL931_17585 [Usitatibacteraceae bacterium]
MTNYFQRIFYFAILVLAGGPLMANECGGKADPCGKRTGWNEFEMVQLRMKQSGVEAPAQWLIQASRENNDLQVEIDFPDAKSPQKGTILMVEGATLLTKGIGFVAGREIDALDWPMLCFILTGKVLSRALPAGPASLSGPREVAHEAKKVGIQFATPSAQGFIPPPWSVKGKVIGNVDGSRDFDLVLRWVEEGEDKVKRPMTMDLAGRLSRNNDFRIDSNMSLVGWNVFGVGPIMEKTESATRLDYGAKPLKFMPKTVADIRAAHAIENSPGEPDASLDLAGFWKEKCSQTFGLRIKPADRPHMYTVTFCGPGGCGGEGNERKTFIKGDKRYKIVSPTELQLGRAEDWTTYKKCSNKMLP